MIVYYLVEKKVDTFYVTEKKSLFVTVSLEILFF